MPSFCNTEGLFGVFDGSLNKEAPGALQEIIPRVLLEEKTIKETSKEYLKYTLLSVHRELKTKTQKYGVDATLVHLTKLKTSINAIEEEGVASRSNYLLTVANLGETKAVLCRASGPLVLAPGKTQNVTVSPQRRKTQQTSNTTVFSNSTPETTTETVLLEEDDEFIIIANRRVWDMLSNEEAVREARAEANPVLAAKRLQDLAQAYGAEDNLSVVVVRLTTPGMGQVDPVGRMMHELRQAVQLKSTRNQMATEPCNCSCCSPKVAPHEAPAACCCHGNISNDSNSSNGFYLNGVVRNVISGR